MGISDRIIRFVLVDLLLGISLMGMDIPIVMANLAFVLCVILVFTIITGYSPLYHLLGISTRSENSDTGGRESTNIVNMN